MEEDSIIEIWNTLKEYISTKDRQTAADHLVSILIDLGVSEEAITKLGEEDKYVEQSVKDALPEEELVDDEDMWDQ
tara:strand:- start:1410 stop:1637 length:228 start_codon:yes stop_codon:yes gene_type:complete